VEKHCNKIEEISTQRRTVEKKRYNLPIIALLLNKVPVLLLILSGWHLITDNHIVLYISLVMSIVWMATFLGGFFHLASIILAVCYLCSGMKKLTVIGIVLSVISIVFPFVLWFTLITFEIVDLRMLP